MSAPFTPEIVNYRSIMQAKEPLPQRETSSPIALSALVPPVDSTRVGMLVPGFDTTGINHIEPFDPGLASGVARNEEDRFRDGVGLFLVEGRSTSFMVEEELVLPEYIGPSCAFPECAVPLNSSVLGGPGDSFENHDIAADIVALPSARVHVLTFQ